MSKADRRRKKGIFITKANRDYVRNILRTLKGQNCCWCGCPMEFPKMGKPTNNLEEMATIEHHFAKKADKPGHLLLLELSHKKCNK